MFEKEGVVIEKPLSSFNKDKQRKVVTTHHVKIVVPKNSKWYSKPE